MIHAYGVMRDYVEYKDYRFISAMVILDSDKPVYLLFDMKYSQDEHRLLAFDPCTNQSRWNWVNEFVDKLIDVSEGLLDLPIKRDNAVCHYRVKHDTTTYGSLALCSYFAFVTSGLHGIDV